MRECYEVFPNYPAVQQLDGVSVGLPWPSEQPFLSTSNLSITKNGHPIGVGSLCNRGDQRSIRGTHEFEKAQGLELKGVLFMSKSRNS